MRFAAKCLSAAIAAGACAFAGERTEDMPMLNWMGREKAATAARDAALKILREDKSLSYRGDGFSATKEHKVHKEGVRSKDGKAFVPLCDSLWLKKKEKMLP